MKEYIDLFVDVKERLPNVNDHVREDGSFYDWYICITEKGLLTKRCYRLFNSTKQGRVTHWLDLSKLTTKDKAQEFAKLIGIKTLIKEETGLIDANKINTHIMDIKDKWL